MRLTLDTHAALLRHLPEIGQVKGRKHGGKRQRFLTKMLGISYERLRPHHADSTRDSFSRDYLTRGLRVSKNGDACASVLRPFYEFEEGKKGWSKDRQETKAYRLRPELMTAMHAVYRDTSPLPVLMEDSEGVETDAPLPANGSPLESLHVPSVIPLSLASVDKAITVVERWIEKTYPHMPLDPDKPKKTTLEGALRLLRVSRKWTASLGGVPNFYVQQDSGRLGPNGFHLISLPSRVRHLLFADSGLMDYDLSSCHWRIFSSLAVHLGFTTLYVDDYIDDRAGWMEHWQSLTGHTSTSDFKAIASSWFTGGTLSSSAWTSGGRLVGPHVMKLLASDPRTLRLYEEVTRGMQQIVKQAASVENGKTVYVNAVGCEAPSSASYHTVCSHLLSGYEQWVIREMCRGVNGLTAIIYDGFIAERIEVKALEERVRQRSSEELGITLDMRLSARDFSVPFEEPQRDAWDF